MNAITKIDENVYKSHELIHGSFSAKQHIDLTAEFPFDLAKRYRWVQYFEAKYTMSSTAPLRKPMELSDWSLYSIHEVITNKITELLSNRYSASTHPYVVAVRLDLSLAHIYILVRTIYGTRTCINRFSEADGTRFST